MFRKVNKQPGMQKFPQLMSHYQEIYDWILPLNKLAGQRIYSNTVVYGGNEYMVIWSLVYFHSFEALKMLLKYNFFEGSFLHPYQRHW